jgi:hypothetical protein
MKLLSPGAKKIKETIPLTTNCNIAPVELDFFTLFSGYQSMFLHELRRHPRFPFHSKGELRLKFMAYRGDLIDISLFGALFEPRLFQLDVNPGDHCSLEILHLNDDSLISVKGEIAHVNKNLIGIRFAPLDKEQQNKLRQIGMLNLAPPCLLNRELPALFQAWQA